jgi:UDP-glucose 4-epimerase
VDLAKAHVMALQKVKELENRNEVFNLGTGIGVTVLDLVKRFIKTTGIPLNYEVGPRRAGDVEKIYADPAKAANILGWRTQLSLEDSLLHAWQWEKQIRGIK